MLFTALLGMLLNLLIAGAMPEQAAGWHKLDAAHVQGSISRRGHTK